MEVGHTYIDCFLQENGTYQAEGFSIDGEVLRVICAYSGETVIVTVIAPDDVTPRGRK